MYNLNNAVDEIRDAKRNGKVSGLWAIFNKKTGEIITLKEKYMQLCGSVDWFHINDCFYPVYDKENNYTGYYQLEFKAVKYTGA